MTSSRKAAIQAYKERKTPRGVFAMRCRVTGNVWVDSAMDLEAALTRLKSFVGTRYDTRVVAAFIAACEAGRIRPGVTRVRRNGTSPLPLSASGPLPDSLLAVS